MGSLSEQYFYFRHLFLDYQRSGWGSSQWHGRREHQMLWGNCQIEDLSVLNKNRFRCSAGLSRGLSRIRLWSRCTRHLAAFRTLGEVLTVDTVRGLRPYLIFPSWNHIAVSARFSLAVAPIYSAGRGRILSPELTGGYRPVTGVLVSHTLSLI